MLAVMAAGEVRTVVVDEEYEVDDDYIGDDH